MNTAPARLAELVAPLSEEEFVALLRERNLALLRGVGRERYSKLLTWHSLLQMIRRGEHPASLAEFSLVMDSKLAPPDRWWKPSPDGDGNVIDLPNLLAYMAAGFSLSVTGLEAFVPRLKTLCDSIRSRLREQIRIGAIVTTGKANAFTLHYDPEDLVILQVEGRKRWKVFGPAVPNPVVGIAPGPPPPEDRLIFDKVLEPGDFLFLPAGNWHRCENQDGRSVHLGVFFQPPSGVDAVRALASKLLSDDQLRVPLSRLEDPASLSAVEGRIKSRAMELVRALDLGEVLSQFEGR